MAAQTGLKWKVSVDINENPASPDYREITQQRGGSLELTHTSVDITNKDDSGWENEKSTRKGWTVDVDGITDENNAAITYLYGNFTGTTTGKDVHVQLKNEDGDTYRGKATLSNFSVDYPESDVVSYAASFKGRGALTITRV